MLNYFKRMEKLISLLLALAFLFPSMAWAFEPRSAELYPISIPETLGKIYSANTAGRKMVVLIQDLHCHQEVQNHIAQIIELLSKDHGLQLVGVEGASRHVNVTKLSTFPVPAVKEQAGKWLLKAGLIGGPEYLAATTSRPVRLLGIENDALYQESLETARAFLNTESLGCVADLREGLQACHDHVSGTPLQMDFDACAQRLDLIEKMLSVSATAEEIAEFQAQRGQYATKAILEGIQKLGGDKLQGNSDAAMLDHYISRAEAFYRMADERSRCFVDNLDQAMTQQGQNLAVMVAGGYHAQGIEQALKAAGFSYLVVTPGMSQADPKNNYWQLLQNQQTKLDRALEQRQNLIALPFNSVQVDGSRQNQVICEKNLREQKLDLMTEQRIIRFFHLTQLLLNAGLLSWLAGQKQWTGLAQKYFEAKQGYPADFPGLEIAPLSQAQIRGLQAGQTAVIPLAREKISLVMSREGKLNRLRSQALLSMNFGNGYDVLVMTNEAVAANRAALDQADSSPVLLLPALRLPKSIADLLAMTMLGVMVQAGMAVVQGAVLIYDLPRQLQQPQALLFLHKAASRFLRPWPFAIRLNGKTPPLRMPDNEAEAAILLARQGMDVQWLHDNFLEIVRTHGIISFARFYLQCGAMSAETFKKKLLELDKAFQPDLPQFWPDILTLSQASGSEGGWKFFRNLVDLKHTFSPGELRTYWDTLVAEGAKAGKYCPDYLSCCGSTVRPLITDIHALQTVSGNLVLLSETYGVLAPDILSGLQTYVESFGPESGLENFTALAKHLVQFKQENVDIDKDHPERMIKDILNSLSLVKTHQVNWQGMFELFHTALAEDPKAAALKIHGLVEGLKKHQIDPDLLPQTIARLKSFLLRYYGFYPSLYWLSVHQPEVFEEVKNFAAQILLDLAGPEEIGDMESKLSQAGIRPIRNAMVGAIQMAIPGYRGSTHVEDYRMRLKYFWEAGDLREHVPQALRGRAFGSCKLKVGNELHDFEFRVVKGMPYALWGLSSNLCYSKEKDVWEEPDFYLAAMVDATTRQVVGFINLYQKDYGQETNLIVPGLEPNGQLLRQADPKQVLLAMENAMFEIARAGGFTNLYLTADLGITSHHIPIRRAAAERYQHLHKDIFRLFNRSGSGFWPKFGNHFPFNSVYALMQDGKPAQILTPANGQTASILDKPVLNKYGRDAWQYRVYTIFGAPIWETPLFQGAGYWLLDYGQHQGNLLLQAAGGLWMTAIFAFAHTMVEWTVRAREIGWQTALSRGYLRSDAKALGLRLLVSGAFSLPFLLLPAGPALILGIALHAGYNYAVLAGWLPGPVASIADSRSGKKDHWLARRGTDEEEAAAEKYLSENGVLDVLEENLAGLLETYGYTSFRWLHQQVGKHHAQGVFHVGLPGLVKAYSEEDLIRYWPDMLRLAWSAGNWPDDLFLKALPGLTNLFTPEELRTYWDVLVEHALQTQEGSTEFLDAALKATRPLITDPHSLETVSRGLAGLARKYSSMVYEVYPQLAKIPGVLGPEAGLRQWPMMVAELERLYESMQDYVTIQLPNMVLDSLELVPAKGLAWKQWLDLVNNWVRADARLATYMQIPGLIQGLAQGDIDPSLKDKTLQSLEAFRRETYGFCSPLFRLYQDSAKFSPVRRFADQILTDSVGLQEITGLEGYLAGQRAPDPVAALVSAVQIAIPGFPFMQSREEDVKRWKSLALAGDFRNHVPEALRNRIFGECELEVGGEKHKIEFRAVKGMPFALWGVNAGLCYADNSLLWEYPGFMLAAMIDKTTGQVAGFMNLVSLDLEGEPRLLVPGLEPNRQFLNQTDPQAVLLAMEKALLEIAAAGNYSGLYVTAVTEISSHRREMQKSIENRYRFKKRKLASVFAHFHLPLELSFADFKPFHNMYVLWEGGQPLGKKRPRTASILDPLVRRSVGEHSAGYQGYTIFGAPAWETPLFQGLGCWLLDYGQAQGSIWLQAAGGLWMTAVFAFAHTIVEWIVRAREVGWRQALSRGYLQSDAKDLGLRLLVSGVFALPFFLLPLWLALPAGIGLHMLYNWGILTGRLPGTLPIASIRRSRSTRNLPPIQKGNENAEKQARDFVGRYVDLDMLDKMYQPVISRYGYVSFMHLLENTRPKLRREWDETLRSFTAFSQVKLLEIWPDIVHLGMRAEDKAFALFNLGFPFMSKKLFRHWDEIAGISLRTRGNIYPFFPHGWDAVEPMLEKAGSVRKLARGIERLSRLPGFDRIRLPGLQKSIQNLMSDHTDYMLDHWDEFVDRLSGLTNKMDVYDVFTLNLIMYKQYFPLLRNDPGKLWAVFELFEQALAIEPVLAPVILNGLAEGIRSGRTAFPRSIPSLPELVQGIPEHELQQYSPLFQLYAREGRNAFAPVFEFGRLMLQDLIGDKELAELEAYFRSQGIRDPELAMAEVFQLYIPEAGPPFKSLEDMRGVYVRHRAAGDLRSQIPPALRSRIIGTYRVRNKQGEVLELECRAVKGIPFGNWGASVGLCYFDDLDVWQTGDFALLAFIDKKHQKVAGFTHVCLEPLQDGKTAVMLPGLEPTDEILFQAPAWELYRIMEHGAREFARLGGYAGCYIPEREELISHQWDFRTIIENLYREQSVKIARTAVRPKTDEPFKFYKYYQFERAYDLTEGVTAGRQPASVMDKVVVKKYGRDAWQYRGYTIFGAPAWETPLFQGLGCWLLDYGQAQGSIWLQAAGGLWMTAIFAFAHTIVEWSVRAREVGWRQALSLGYLRTDARDFGARLLVSGLFSLPFFLLPAGPAMLLAILLHALYNYAVLEGWLRGPVAAIGIPELIKCGTKKEEEARGILLNECKIGVYHARFQMVFERFGYAHLVELARSMDANAIKDFEYVIKYQLSTAEEMLACYPGLIHLAKKLGARAGELFEYDSVYSIQNILKDKKRLPEFWPALVSLGAEAGEHMLRFFKALSYYSNHPNLIQDAGDLVQIGRGFLTLYRTPGSDLDLRFNAARHFESYLGNKDFKNWNRMLEALAQVIARTDIYARTRMFNSLNYYRPLFTDHRSAGNVLALMQEITHFDSRLGPFLFANLGLALEKGLLGSNIKKRKIREVLSGIKSYGREALSPLFQYYLATGEQGFEDVRTFGNLILKDQVGWAEMSALRQGLESKGMVDTDAALAEAVHTVLPDSAARYKSINRELLIWHIRTGDLRHHIALHVKKPVIGTYPVQAVDNSLIEIEFRVVKGIPYGNWGQSIGLCFGDDMPLWRNENFLLLAMIDKTHGQVAGFIHLYFEKNARGDKVLMLPGLEPTPELLHQVQPKPLLQVMQNALARLCGQEGYAGAYLPDAQHLICHDPEFEKAIKQYFAPAEIHDMSRLLGRDTEARQAGSGFLNYYTFTKGWAVWEKPAPQGGFDQGIRARQGFHVSAPLDSIKLTSALFGLILWALDNTFVGPIAKTLAMHLDPGACVTALLQAGKYPAEIRSLFLDADHNPKPWLQNSAARTVLPNVVSELTRWLAANPCMAGHALGLLNDLAPLSYIRVGNIQGRPVRLPRVLWTRGQEHRLGRLWHQLRLVPDLRLEDKIFERKLPTRQRTSRQAA